MNNTILITGAGGEVGHSLINYYLDQSDFFIVATDLKETINNPYRLFSQNRVLYYQGDITNQNFISEIFSKHQFDGIFHLAAVLSSGGEKNPAFTHNVNVNGTLNILENAQIQSNTRKIPTKIIFPSTIAVYGLKSDDNYNDVNEELYLSPITMYGNNKLYVENLGRYYSRYYKFTTLSENDCLLDFRSLRFPGLLSAETVPTGGTSDYAPEMIHAAAQNQSYECFVSALATLPFMTMPDAISALTKLFSASKEKLTSTTYNVTSFSVSAEQIENLVKNYFPNFKVTYKPNPKREQIVNSWPNSINDQKARQDWHWRPRFNFTDAFEKYLIPAITKHYQK